MFWLPTVAFVSEEEVRDMLADIEEKVGRYRCCVGAAASILAAAAVMLLLRCFYATLLLLRVCLEY